MGAETVAQRLKIAFDASGLTQGELARSVNAVAGTSWSAGYVGRLMKGERPAKQIDPVAVFALADALGVDPRWLWMGLGHMVRAQKLQKITRGRAS